MTGPQLAALSTNQDLQGQMSS